MCEYKRSHSVCPQGYTTINIDLAEIPDKMFTKHLILQELPETRAQTQDRHDISVTMTSTKGIIPVLVL